MNKEMNICEFKNLIDTDFSGNYTKCAKALNVTVSSISRLINKKQGIGVKVVFGLMAYCEAKGKEVKIYFK